MKRFLIVAITVLVTACGSSINGTWVGTETPQGGYGNTTATASQATATLTANGSTISGQFTSSVFRATATVSGSYSGNTISGLTLTFAQGSGCQSMTGSGTLNGNTLQWTLQGCGMTETVQLQKQ